MKLYRQGDVALLFRQIDETTEEDLIPLAATNGAYVLAYGSATGKAHYVDTHSAFLFEDDAGTCFLKAKDGCVLQHQQHASIVLLEGWYEIRRQSEVIHGQSQLVAD